MSVIAMDCEMVGDMWDKNMLAKVSIVDQNQRILYNSFVAPTSAVKDYRTKWSGIRPGDLDGGEPFQNCQANVRQILDLANVIVGHDLKHDFAALKLDIGLYAHKIKDTMCCLAVYYDDNRSLKYLARKYLNLDIQMGTHNSVEDARTCMALYLKY